MTYLKAVALACIAVFAPIKAAVIAAFALVILDMITGIWASVKRKEPITSAGIKRTVGKILLYESAICIAFLVETYLTGDLFPASKIVTALVGMAELKSLTENLSTISGNDLTTAILTKISNTDITK